MGDEQEAKSVPKVNASNEPKPTSKMAQMVLTAVSKRNIDSIYALMRAIGELQRDVSMLWPYRIWMECIARDLRRINPGLSTESEPNNVANAVTALANELQELRKLKRANAKPVER
jgi:hypothetical protein